MTNVILFPVKKRRRSKIGDCIIQQAAIMAGQPKLDGYFIVTWDKSGAHEVSFSLGEGVIGATILPSWLGDVARRYSLVPTAASDMMEDDGA